MQEAHNTVPDGDEQLLSFRPDKKFPCFFPCVRCVIDIIRSSTGAVKESRDGEGASLDGQRRRFYSKGMLSHQRSRSSRPKAHEL
jgi:hypothetical protein